MSRKVDPLEIRVCEICGNEYHPKRFWQKFCGNPCKYARLSATLTLNLLGRKFGRLEVKGRVGNSYPPKWLCLCKCGNFIEVITYYLTCGRRTSCGCLQQEARKQTKNRKRPFESLYNKVVASSKYNKLELTLTFEEFLTFTTIPECTYCGASLFWPEFSSINGKITSEAYNLDRKDNSSGYSKENCVTCCIDCNKAKGARYTFDEWVTMTKALRELRKGRAACCTY